MSRENSPFVSRCPEQARCHALLSYIYIDPVTEHPQRWNHQTHLQQKDTIKLFCITVELLTSRQSCLLPKKTLRCHKVKSVYQFEVFLCGDTTCSMTAVFQNVFSLIFQNFIYIYPQQHWSKAVTRSFSIKTWHERSSMKNKPCITATNVLSPLQERKIIHLACTVSTAWSPFNFPFHNHGAIS